MLAPLLLSTLLVWPGPDEADRGLAAQDADVRLAPTLGQEDAREELEARAAQRALENGLAYLARRQAQTVTGAFPPDDRQPERGTVGITALSTLAMLAGGSSPGRGPFGNEVARAVDYLLEKTDLAPSSPTFGFIAADGDGEKTRMHGHGFATLVLAEAYGMAPRQRGRIGRALEAAVRLIENSQGTEGGWEYEPRAIAAHEGSVTICLVQALRAARNSGIRVDLQVVRRAEDYVVRLQKTDGTFRYQLDTEDSTIGLTAAAVTTLNMVGRYDDTVVKSAVDAVWSGLLLQREDGHERSRFPYYQRLYIAQAFWQLSDSRNFERWFADERPRILRAQESDGSWSDARWGDCYATAVNCLVLAIPDGLLPIFQR